MTTNFFYSNVMMRKEEFYGAKKSIKIQDVDVINIVN